MNSLIIQIVLPFILSALIVIIIMFIAEKYGSKVGGILGTLPSTIVIAFIFIALNQDIYFAAKSAAVVPAELGINIIFLLIFVLYVEKSMYLAFLYSLSGWTLLSSIIFFINLDNIFYSVIIYVTALIFSIFILEYIKKIPSSGNVIVHYTPIKIAFRGIVAGIFISIAVILSNIGTTISGIFSVFPAIITSTMYISVREHGPIFASGIAKSMILGISSVAVYSTMLHFLLPIFDIIYSTIIAYIISIIITMFIFRFRSKIL